MGFSDSMHQFSLWIQCFVILYTLFFLSQIRLLWFYLYYLTLLNFFWTTSCELHNYLLSLTGFTSDFTNIFFFHDKYFTTIYVTFYPSEIVPTCGTYESKVGVPGEWRRPYLLAQGGTQPYSAWTWHTRVRVQHLAPLGHSAISGDKTSHSAKDITVSMFLFFWGEVLGINFQGLLLTSDTRRCVREARRILHTHSHTHTYVQTHAVIQVEKITRNFIYFRSFPSARTGGGLCNFVP